MEKVAAMDWNKRDDTEIIERLKKILEEYKTGTGAGILIVKVAGIVLEYGWAEEPAAKEKQAAPGAGKPTGAFSAIRESYKETLKIDNLPELFCKEKNNQTRRSLI